MVRWLRWHCPPDTGFEIRALAVWGRARYLSVTEAPHNTNFHTWMGKKQFCFFQTAETGNRTPDSGVKGSGVNHYPRAPALLQPTLIVCCPIKLLYIGPMSVFLLLQLWQEDNALCYVSARQMCAWAATALAPVTEAGFSHRLTHIQNRGTFLWTVLSKTRPHITRKRKHF